MMMGHRSNFSRQIIALLAWQTADASLVRKKVSGAKFEQRLLTDRSTSEIRRWACGLDPVWSGWYVRFIDNSRNSLTHDRDRSIIFRQATQKKEASSPKPVHGRCEWDDSQHNRCQREHSGGDSLLDDRHLFFKQAWNDKQKVSEETHSKESGCSQVYKFKWWQWAHTLNTITDRMAIFEQGGGIEWVDAHNIKSRTVDLIYQSSIHCKRYRLLFFTSAHNGASHITNEISFELHWFGSAFNWASNGGMCDIGRFKSFWKSTVAAVQVVST